MYYYGGYSGYGCQQNGGYGYSSAIILVLFMSMTILMGI